jgi:DNA mismatch repair protein MutS
VAKLAGLPDVVTERAKQVLRVLEKTASATSRVTQLDFEDMEAFAAVQAPSEVLETLRRLDPETLTPLEALNVVYELKKNLADEDKG